MQEVCIEKGIPIPTQRKKSKWSHLENMEVGDSIEVFYYDYEGVRAYLIRRGMKVTMRTVDIGAEIRRIRLWRTG